MEEHKKGLEEQKLALQNTSNDWNLVLLVVSIWLQLTEESRRVQVVDMYWWHCHGSMAGRSIHDNNLLVSLQATLSQASHQRECDYNSV